MSEKREQPAMPSHTHHVAIVDHLHTRDASGARARVRLRRVLQGRHDVVPRDALVFAEVHGAPGRDEEHGLHAISATRDSRRRCCAPSPWLTYRGRGPRNLHDCGIDDGLLTHTRSHDQWRCLLRGIWRRVHSKLSLRTSEIAMGFAVLPHSCVEARPHNDTRSTSSTPTTTATR